MASREIFGGIMEGKKNLFFVFATIIGGYNKREKGK